MIMGFLIFKHFFAFIFDMHVHAEIYTCMEYKQAIVCCRSFTSAEIFNFQRFHAPYEN
jgi:hypothetical protein